MEPSSLPVDDFLAGLADPRAEQLRTLDQLIVECAPDVTRRLWTGVFWGGTEQQIIGYRDWASQRRDGGRVEWFRVGIALQKAHISVYLNATEDGQYLAKRYGDRLGKVRVTSAAVAFKRIEDVELAELERLIGIALARHDDEP